MFILKMSSENFVDVFLDMKLRSVRIGSIEFAEEAEFDDLKKYGFPKNGTHAYW